MLYKKQITIICIVLALFAFYQSTQNPHEETIQKLGQYKWQEIQEKRVFKQATETVEANYKYMHEAHERAEQARREIELLGDSILNPATTGSNRKDNGRNNKSHPDGNPSDRAQESKKDSEVTFRQPTE